MGRKLVLDTFQVEDLAFSHPVSVLEVLLEGAPGGLRLNSVLGQRLLPLDLLRVQCLTSGEHLGDGVESFQLGDELVSSLRRSSSLDARLACREVVEYAAGQILFVASPGI